ncbi:protein tyrosine phosphatase [Paenibacillus jamilae]|uniref:sulfotransferase family protein n=1 Tax=Paenibacillus jamilae TaxID=114136 RepID=UPI0007AC0F99|nr:protein tyrosine phosphatase [Paenibacillus jamilae]
MIDKQGGKLVFLLSVPRSGSSLLTAILQNHSRLFATQEMWFLLSLYDLPLSHARPYGGTGILRQFFKGMVPPQVLEQASRSYALEIYNGLLQGTIADMLIDKSPRYYTVLEFLDRLFPAARRVWLIRNPLAIVASFKKVNQLRGESFHLLKELGSSHFNMKMTDITVGLFRYAHYFATPHPLAYPLMYEQLVANPMLEIEKLCHFLGVHYEPGMERYGSFADTPQSSLFYSMGAGDPFVIEHEQAHQNSVHSWQHLLSTMEIELYCRSIGARLFRQLGYGEALEQAEQLTGVRFEDAPDVELLSRRTHQFLQQSGFEWKTAYRMLEEQDAYNKDLMTIATHHAAPHTTAEMDMAQMVSNRRIQSLENRLAQSLEERNRLIAQLQSYQRPSRGIRSHLLTRKLRRWASIVLSSIRKEKGGERECNCRNL